MNDAEMTGQWIARKMNYEYCPETMTMIVTSPDLHGNPCTVTFGGVGSVPNPDTDCIFISEVD